MVAGNAMLADDVADDIFLFSLEFDEAGSPRLIPPQEGVLPQRGKLPPMGLIDSDG